MAAPALTFLAPPSLGDDGDDSSTDPNTPSRTRFRRGNLLVIAGADGMVLRVNRRSR